MATSLSAFCIYTIKHDRDLDTAAARGKAGWFREGKPWRTGQRLLREAKADKVSLPVLLAYATDCGTLRYWGVLTKVVIDDKGTRYWFDKLRRIPGRRRTQELTLRSSRKKIAPHFIRPYAICETPTFLKRS